MKQVKSVTKYRMSEEKLLDDILRAASCDH